MSARHAAPMFVMLLSLVMTEKKSYAKELNAEVARASRDSRILAVHISSRRRWPVSLKHETTRKRFTRKNDLR